MDELVDELVNAYDEQHAIVGLEGIDLDAHRNALRAVATIAWRRGMNDLALATLPENGPPRNPYHN